MGLEFLAVKILVVDDDASLRRALCRSLRLRGFLPTEAGSAEEALVLLERGEPAEVMLCDVEWPGIDGFALAARVRARNAASAIVFMSGSGDRAPDGTAVLAKPFDEATLIAAVRDALARRDPSSR